MSLAAVCAVFGYLYISSSLLSESLPAVAVVLVTAPLGAIIIGHHLRDIERTLNVPVRRKIRTRDDSVNAGPGVAPLPGAASRSGTGLMEASAALAARPKLQSRNGTQHSAQPQKPAGLLPPNR